MEQDLHQGCTYLPLCVHTLFAVVTHMTYTPSEVDNDAMGTLFGLRKKTGQRVAVDGYPASATSLLGMLYAVGAALVLQLPELLRNIMVVIGTMCAAFGPTVSETKFEIVYLRTRGTPNAAITFTTETVGQMYKQAHDFVNHDTKSTEVDRRTRIARCSCRNVHP